MTTRFSPLVLVEEHLAGVGLALRRRRLVAFLGRRQRRHPQLLAARGVPFVFATGYGQEGLDPAWRGLPTLMKPFEFETFRGAVERMLAGG